MATNRRTATKPDPNFEHLLTKSNEEVIAEQEAIERKRAESGYPKVEINERGSAIPRDYKLESHDQHMDEFEDVDFDPLGAGDPLVAIKRAFQRPGMRLKAMSEQCNSHLGTRRYQIVKDPQTGDPVRFGKMVIGEIPEAIAQRRSEAVINITKRELGQIQDQTKNELAELKAEAARLGMTLLKEGDRVSSGGRSYDVGIGITRDEDLIR